MKFREICATLIFGLMTLLSVPVTSFAATFTVVNTNDSGAGSLRDAINAAGLGDTINFNLTYPATITLTSATLTINQNLTMIGPGASNLTISGNSLFTVLSIGTGANVNLSGVSIVSGNATGTGVVFNAGGGGISNSGTLALSYSTVSGNNTSATRTADGGGIFNNGTLTLLNSIVSNNTATGSLFGGHGGGIFNNGALTIINSALSGNSAGGSNAQGGGLFSQGPLIMIGSTVVNNSSNGSGGGIYNTGSATLSYNSLSGNAASADASYSSGGGIFNSGALTLTGSSLVNNSCLNTTTSSVAGAFHNIGSATLTNTTLSGNSCVSEGPMAGAIYNTGSLFLTQSTVYGNFVHGFSGGTGNGGIRNDQTGSITLKSTVLANNAGNCTLITGGIALSAGYNLSDDNSCPVLLAGAGDLNNTPAGLDPNGPQDNGGPTQTIALLAGSPVIDAVPAGASGFCTAADGVTAVITDQRTITRPQGTGCDMGAFETASAAAILTLSLQQSTPLALGQQGTYIITVSNAAIALPSAGTVTVSDPLPSGLSLASMSGAGWSCSFTTCTRSDTLAPGGSYPPVTVAVNVASNAVSPLVNTVTLSGGGSGGASASEPALLVGSPILSITSTHTGSFALGQQSATYAITVSNASASGPTSGAVTVTDALPAGLSLVSMAGTGWNCTGNACSRNDVLTPGASYPQITVTANVAAHATSPQVNSVTVSGGGWATAGASDPTKITGVPVLSIAKSHTGNFTLGQQGTYTLTVSNASGAGPTSGAVSVTDNLPGGLTLALMGGTGWFCMGTTCSRSEVLAAGASYPAISVIVNVAANATSPQVNSAIVSGGGSATAGATDPTAIVGVPVLSIAKTHTGNFVLGQQGATYTLTVSNAGGLGPTSGTVSVTDNLPAGLILVSMAGSGWTCLSGTCTRSDALAAGANYPPITVGVNVTATATSPQVNHATVSGGGSTPATAADPTLILLPLLSIAKTHTGNFAQGQQSAIYTLTVSNAGGSAATAGVVSVTDTLPAGLTLVSMSGPGWSCASSTCTRSDALASGASYPAITVTVNVPPAAPSTVTNIATVSGGGSTSASASDPTTISPALYTISGSVTVGGAALSGVTVSLSGTFSGSTVTNASGAYGFSGLYGGGSYTVSAALSGYRFSAPITFSNLSTNQTANFTANAIQNQVARAVFRDSHGAIQMTTYPSSTLSSAGGVFASDPSVAEDVAGNVFATARDTFNSIWANVYNPNTATWAGWNLGGGITQGMPSIAVDTAGKAWIASRDNYNSYWLVSYSNGTGFGSWLPLLGIFSTDPVITSCNDGSIYLIGKDNFNSLWSGHYVPGTGFQGWQFGGGIIKGKPAATCGGDNAVYVAAEDNFNSNWMARVAGNTWTGWFFGGAITSVTPRIAALGNGAEAVVILDPTNVVWRTTFTEGIGNGWQQWTQVPGILQDLAPAAVNGQLYLSGKAPNGDLWWWQQNGNQWTWIGNNGMASGLLSAAPK